MSAASPNAVPQNAVSQDAAASPTPPATRVLVADDDPRTRDVLRRYLTRAGHTVLEADNGVDALDRIRRDAPDVVVLDLMMPGMDGLDVCELARRESEVPIMMLTALGSESDRVSGLETGADDYVVKPFSPREVTLRVERLLARARPTPQTSTSSPRKVIRDGELQLDVAARIATRNGTRLELTQREFDLLAFLISHPLRAFSRSDLLQHVWQWSFGDDSTVTVHVRRLREKVEPDPRSPERIQTVWGVGYRYHQPDSGADERDDSR